MKVVHSNLEVIKLSLRNNPKDLYRKEEYVGNEEVLQLDDDFVKPSKLVAFGCTSRGQARRLGKWKMLSENLNTQTVILKLLLMQVSTAR